MIYRYYEIGQCCSIIIYYEPTKNDALSRAVPGTSGAPASAAQRRDAGGQQQAEHHSEFQRRGVGDGWESYKNNGDWDSL